LTLVFGGSTALKIGFISFDLSSLEMNPIFKALLTLTLQYVYG